MKRLWRYILILIVVILFWNHPILGPLNNLSLVFHKIGHALTAFFSGYGYYAFERTLGTNGDAVIEANSWFASFMISNGGYLGSIFFSAMLLLLKKTNIRKYLAGCTAIIYLAICISYPGFNSTMVNSVIFASLIIIVYMIQKDILNEWIIDIIGISIIAYIIYDTFVSTLLFSLNQQISIVNSWRTQLPDDIIRLSQSTNMPALLWGIIWLVIAVVVLNAIVLKGSKK